MTDRERIEKACESHVLRILGWHDDEYGVAHAELGRFVVVHDEYEDDGLYSGDKGHLSACVVGAAEYHNQRVAFSFAPDECDEGNEVRDLTVLDPVDD